MSKGQYKIWDNERGDVGMEKMKEKEVIQNSKDLLTDVEWSDEDYKHLGKKYKALALDTRVGLEQLYEAVKEKKTVSGVASAVGVSRTTLYKWMDYDKRIAKLFTIAQYASPTPLLVDVVTARIVEQSLAEGYEETTIYYDEVGNITSSIKKVKPNPIPLNQLKEVRDNLIAMADAIEDNPALTYKDLQDLLAKMGGGRLGDIK